MQLVGLIITFGVVGVLMLLVGHMRLHPSLKRVLLAAIAFRVVGSIVYYVVVESAYGVGDYVLYHDIALEYAERMWRGDFRMFVRSAEWHGERWWSTQFVFFPAGLVVMLFGSNILSAFIVFSLFAFAGLAALTRAFARNFPGIPPEHYAFWIFLFPSLWFWSSVLGKDALLLCGVGVAVYGFAGDHGRFNWLPFCLGVALVFGVRPQVAAVLLLAMVIAFWAATTRTLSAAKVFQAAVVTIAGVALIHVALGTAGAGGAELEGIEEYVETKSSSAAQGRTSVETVSPGWQSAPLAMVNILFRPLPWEATSALSLLASAEIWTLWAIAFYRRRNIVVALRSWNSHRLIAFSLIFILIYSVSLGLVVVNMGIIARQRIVLFPFLFLLMEARPAIPFRFTGTSVRGRGRPPVPASRMHGLPGN